MGANVIKKEASELLVGFIVIAVCGCGVVRLSCAVAIVNSFICRVWDLDLDGLIIVVEKLARLGQITPALLSRLIHSRRPIFLGNTH